MAPSSAGLMKRVKSVLPPSGRHWVGNGFHVYPVFANKAFTAELSPWLMFDYAAPKSFPPTSSKLGVGTHPHRGFETVTIAFQGEVEHGDSVGNRDVIGPGDVQWMTAARGIIHEEYHSTNFAKTGGTFEMCQLWLNLPKKDKMKKPEYQPILAKQIPTATTSTDCSVRVIAGTCHGVTGPAKTHTPVNLWDIALPTANRPVEIEVPANHNTIVFVRRGKIAVGPSEKPHEVESQGVALMHRDGDILRIDPKEKDTQVLLLGGEPIDEPIAAQGPFVMNTHDEIRQAHMDFMSGKLGR
ncbi:hypothetical protein PPROV_000491100 [Pycnococcus provasolii]|uniref:Pirin N-terminal domain-containing protein n=1 Tax=Pycnococcus provasolii TaxID=41880 RepID=A0A830HGD3_9CHLO|nr:hypothetical protein PPROV_000491100 [Pycnococcus provasolii]